MYQEFQSRLLQIQYWESLSDNENCFTLMFLFQKFKNISETLLGLHVDDHVITK